MKRAKPNSNSVATANTDITQLAIGDIGGKECSTRITKDEHKGTSKSLNHLVNTKLHKPSTSYTIEKNREPTDEAEFNKDDETEDPK